MLQLRRKKEPPNHLLKHTYQNELRAIGRFCDDNRLRCIGIYEVDDGFVLRALTDANDPHSVEAIEVPKDDIQSLIMKNFTSKGRTAPLTRSPLCPTGYEDFLRALGYELEINQGRGVTIQEMVDRIGINYHQLQATSEEGYVWEPRSAILTAADIQNLLDEAFNRRGLNL
jgi:hypothetical protein